VNSFPLKQLLCCVVGLICTVAVLLAANSGDPTAQAAPAKPIHRKKPAPVKKADPQAQRVMTALTRVLQGKISSPGGKMQLILRPTARAGQGYFSEIYLAAHPAAFKKKMRISELVMRARNVRVDVPHLLREGKVNTLASTTTLRAVITENDLTSLLASGKHTASMGLRVKYIGDRMRVTGNWNWGWFSGPVIGIGRLRLAPGYKINFDILSLKLNGAEVPQFVKNKFSEKLNPVIDYEEVPFQPHFRGVKVQGSKATVYA
jgi:hypothetical protein